TGSKFLLTLRHAGIRAGITLKKCRGEVGLPPFVSATSPSDLAYAPPPSPGDEIMPPSPASGRGRGRERPRQGVPDRKGRPHMAAPKRITLNVNGAQHGFRADPEMPLLYALRNEVGLDNPHFGC